MCIGVLYEARFYLWKAAPRARPFVWAAFLSSRTFDGQQKPEVLESLGGPDQMEGPYSVLWAARETEFDRTKPQSDLVFAYDDDGSIVRIAFVWDSYVPPKWMPFDAVLWRDGSEETRAAMCADLVQRFEGGRIPESLNDVNDVHNLFSHAVFVDEWQYAIDANDGFVCMLTVRFDPLGTVYETVFEYFDP